MSSDSRDLLARIEAFPIDGPDLPALPFAARLARENGWSRAYAERAVREYKRFVFLALTAGRPVCPSEQVDAVWHLHLTYTRSYWKRFCGEVLGQPLHHEPTKGGGEEADKHLRMYAGTLAAYRQAFGHEPPADLWPDADTRFGSDLRHVAVNTAHNWVIPKGRVRQAAAGVGLLVVLVAGLGCGGLNPFELKGTEFLVFLLPMLAVTAAAGLVIRNVMSGPKLDPDEPLPDLTWTQTALLAGNAGRLLDAAIARLIADGAARVSADETKLEKHGPAGDLTAIERVVYNSLPLSKSDPKALKKLREEVEAKAAADEAKLQADGLVLDDARAKTVGRLAALPYALVLVGLGGSRLLMGLVNDKSVGYLVAALVIGAVVGLVLFARRLRVTHKGQAVLKRWQTRLGGLKERAAAAADGYDPALAVALFGTAALAGTEYGALQRWYPRDTSGGGCGSGCGTTSSGCGGGGDGGGGGGGCGGCGGGGGD